MKNFINEFKAFILRGNVVDMAVGVVVGNSFKNISTSLVNDVIMPAIGMMLGKVNFAELKIVLQEAVVAADGTELAAEVAIRYGAFIQTIVDFLIVAAAVFVMIKVFALLTEKRKQEEVVEEAPVVVEEPKPTSEDLLTEIRDLLKAK
jgi:large conductance mechanosensitive channel